MASIFWRSGRKRYCIQVLSNGHLIQRAGGRTLSEAKKLLREIEEGLCETDEGAAEPKLAPPTLKDLVDPWLARRRARGLRNVDVEEGHFQNHVLPRFRNVSPADIRPKDVRSFVESLQAKKLAPRTVSNIYGTLHVFYTDLIREEVVDRSPCVLSKHELPRHVDKVPGWRATAIFSRSEVEALISSSRVPAERRALWAVLFLSGARLGEALGLRWTDINDGADQLHRLVIARSYNQSTKTDTVREVPVHPVLAAVLAEWKLSGFERWTGRKPEPDDLIVPTNKLRMRSRRHTWNLFTRDLEVLGLRHRRIHDARRTFVSLMQADGAPRHVIELITHKGRGTVLDLYTTLPWQTLCDAVSGLKISRKGPAEVVPIRAAKN